MSEILRAYERGVLRVTLNRPDERNALSRTVLRELKRVFDAHAKESDLRLAVLSGSGELAFCAGVDPADLAEIRAHDEAEAFASDGRAALDAIRHFPAPTVAALNGIALGSGAELALACDMRVAAAHARIGYIHANPNVTASWGGGADLTRLVGYGRAMELLAAGRTLSSEEARQMGLFNRVAHPGVSFIEFIDRFVEPMRDRVPQVMRALKAQAIADRLGQPAAERGSAEAEGVADASDSAEDDAADA